MRRLVHGMAEVGHVMAEKSINALESATGLDIDGDGDVGVAGHGARTPRGGNAPAPSAGDAQAPEPAPATPRSSQTMTSGGRVGRTSYLPAVKLLDFGVSQVCVDALEAPSGDGEKKRFDDTILKATGTPLFFSPEMCHLPAIPFHGRPADVWAAGVTLCMLVSGELPFSGDNIPEIWRKVQESPPELDTVLPKSCSVALRETLSAMLEKDPNKRPTVSQLRSYKWVTRSGAEPMPEQDHLPLQITDDDIKQAVQRFSDTFSILKAGKKWKKNTLDKKSMRESVANAASAGRISEGEEHASKAAESETTTTPAPATAERI